MPARSLYRASALVLAAALAGCAADSTAPDPETNQAGPTLSLARPAETCANVQVTASSTLGLWSVNGVSGFGAQPFETTLAGIPGVMASAVSSESISGGKAQGAHHIFLSHYFWGEDGSWFRTDDRASCAPADNDPATCQVNDHMRLVEGAGRFENATGQIHNHGFLHFTSPGPPPSGTIDLRVIGRICGAGL
jgi:hypothetical protein